MRSAILAVALLSAVGVVALAEPGSERSGQGRFPLIVQEVEGVAANPSQVVQELRRTMRDYEAMPVAFSLAGNRFTCAQIRVMDEVELITDDSYCD